MKIYVASSWRNALQPSIVETLRAAGHDVYDFRNPPGGTGFSWRTIHPDWQNWTPEQYRDALEHPIAKAGFESDMNALRECDACVLVLPSGRSASWEFGWAIGNGKCGAVVMLEKCEPELMYLGNPILTTAAEIVDWATTVEPPLDHQATKEHHTFDVWCQAFDVWYAKTHSQNVPSITKNTGLTPAEAFAEDCAYSG